MPRGVRVMTESAALTFGAATDDRVNLGTAPPIDNLTALTMLLWANPTTLTGGRRLFTKGIGASTIHTWNVELTAGNLSYTRSRVTTAVSYITNWTPIATLNKWYCLALTYDLAATPSARILVGDVATPAREGTYSASADGAGTLFDDSANDLVMGNKNAATFDSAFRGRFAAGAWFNRALPLAEIQAWQFSALDEPLPAVMAGCVGLWYPGNDGPNKVIDYSGYHNDGTITGATVSRGVSLPARDAVRDRLRARS